MLQSGIGFEELRGGHTKCPVLKCTPVTQIVVEPLARSKLCKPYAAQQQIET